MERRADPIDRRIKRVFLTDTVQGLMRQLREIAADIRRDAVEGLRPDEQDTLFDLLQRVKGNLQTIDPVKGPSMAQQAMAADD